MAKQCRISLKKTVFGNRVSHANNKSRRRFLPNLQKFSLFSEKLGKKITLSITPYGMRTVEHNGGIDSYLIKTSSQKLTPFLKKIKKQLISIKKDK